MSAFRLFLLNPNVHIIFGLIAQVASLFPAAAPFAMGLQLAGVATTAFAGILPEHGSLHAADYERLTGTVAQAVAQAVSQAVPPAPARQ